MDKKLEFRVNGKQVAVDSESERSLLAVLRDELELTGSKYGCGEGQCGACTVLLDGVATRSCLTPIVAAAGKQIKTIEGLEQGGRLHPLQQAFLDQDALQCGYCTSGMIMSALALLGKNRAPGEQEIVRAMQGNICRCGTYPRIIAAVKKAAGIMRRNRS